MLLLTGKCFVVSDDIRNDFECVPPGVEVGICAFTVDCKSEKDDDLILMSQLARRNYSKLTRQL